MSMKILKSEKIGEMEVQLREYSERFSVQVLDHRGDEEFGDGLNYFQDFNNEKDALNNFNNEVKDFEDRYAEEKRIRDKIDDPENPLKKLMKNIRGE